jgi:FdhD protein
MGWQIADKVGLTMLGRAVNRHYLLFTGKHRFVKTAMPTMLA